MLRRGVWANEDQVVGLDGRVVGPVRVAKRVGVKISGLYSPWVLFGQLASEFIEAKADPNALADFINQRLAEPFEEQRQKTDPDMIREKVHRRTDLGWEVLKDAPPAGVIPQWARVLIATADTQGTNEQDGHFYYTVRAWGYDYRSQLVDFGVANSKDELKQRTIEKSFPIEGGGQASPIGIWTDSGGPRWSEIYQLAQSDVRIHPTKGAAEGRTWMVEEKPQKKHNVVLWLIDTEQSKDLTHRLMHDADKTKHMPNAGINADYCKQMSAESKVFNPQTKREEWVEIIKNNNHFWDCEAMQCAVAWRLGCGMPEPKQEQFSRPDSESGGIDPNSWVSSGKRW